MEAGAGGNGWELVVPACLLMIMVCMGLELTLADFRRVIELPRATLVGFLGQMVLLPAVGFSLAHWPGFAPEIAIGIVIITACPGGAMSNVFSYLARANLALSVTLTALSCLVCFATIPLWLWVAIDRFAADLAGDVPLELPLGAAAARLFALTLLPVAVGMGARASWPAWAARVRQPLRRAMSVLLGIAIVAIVASEWEQVARDLETSAIASTLR